MQFPLTPHGTLDVTALFAKNRAIYGDARMEGEGEGGEGGDGGEGSTYKPPATQAELDRIISNRVTRATSKFSDYDTLRTKAERHDALELELGTAADKAAAAARQDERAKASAELAPRLVRAEFKAAAAGRIEADRLAELIEDLDLSKYLNDKGEVDEERVSKKVTAWAPAASTSSKGGQRTDLGQGNRSQSHAQPGDAGRAAAERRYPAKS